MKSNWTRRWWARIHATLVWRRFRERALLRAARRSRRDQTRRSGLVRLDGLARLEPRALLAADIATDRFDYAPGSTALITTFSDGGPDHNFQVGETIRFQVVRTDGLADTAPGNLPWKVTDGVGGFAAYVDETGVHVAPDRDGVADGRIETDWFVGSEYANASLEVRATGLGSGVTATRAFHDSAIVISSSMNWSQITTGSGVNGAPTANDSIVVNQGATLTINVNGAVAGAVTLGNGGTGTAALAFSAGTIGATFGSLANNGTATVTFNNAASTLTVGTANTTTTFAGAISGAGSLTKTGSGTLTLSGANTFTGGTNINGGVLALGSTGALGTTGTISFGGGTLQHSANNTTSYAARFSTAANQLYAIDTNGQNVTLVAPLTSSGGSLRKLGTGTLTLSGTNTYTGGTLVSAGTLAYSASNQLSDTGSVTVNGGTLSLGGYTDTVGAVSVLGGGTISGGGAITGGAVGNADFEAVAVTGFGKPTGASWSFTNYAYISANGSAYGFANTTSGSQFGILQTFSNTVSSLSQTISVATAGYASFAFRGQGRPSYGSAGIELVIDGTTQSTWPASAFTPGAWGDYISQPVSLTAGTHTLQFRSMTNAIGDVATAIDAIKVNLPGLTGSSYDLQNGTVSANLGGSAALAKTGSGTVTLSGTNTSTGGVTINGGVLALGSAGALGTTGTISFGGGTLQYSASNTTDYTSRFSSAANQVTSVDTNGQNVTFAGALVSSGGSLRKVGAGTLTLTGSNTHTGGTFVTGGVLASGANNVLPDAGAITVNGGTLALGTYSDTVGAVSLLAGSITSTTGVLTGSGYSVQNGTVSAILAGTGVLAKTGSSTDTVTLTGENIYTGGTTINGGVLALGSVGALGTIGTITFGGGTLQHSAGNVTDYTARFSRSANQPYSVDTNGQNVTYAGALVSSGGSLTKAGTGTLTLTGTNTYTGGTTLSGGVLSLGSAGALGTTGTISFGGGTLQYTSANTTDYSARFSTAAVQNFLIDTGTQNISFATALASSGGTLTKTGTGKLTLAGDNQFTAPTTFNGTSDYLSLPSTGYDNFTAGFSAAVWAKPTANANWARFFDFGSGAAVGNILLCRSGTSNNLAFDIYNQAQGQTTHLLVSNVIENNVWQHFAVTMTSSGTVTIYKNGAVIGTATGQPMPVVMARTNNYIGKSNWSPDALYSGSMADGQIWNTALTGTEIATVKGGGEVQTQARLASFASRPVIRNNFVTGPNTPLTVSAGTVQIGNDAGTSGAFAGDILNNGTLVFSRADAASYAGAISGTGALEKRGSGTLTLTGTNTFTGGTTITGGVLALGSAAAIGTSGTISFGGGTLQYSASNTTDYSARFSPAANQTYSIDTNGQNVTFAGALASSGGALRKAGAGRLTLTGSSTFTGGTTVAGGVLRIGANNVLADSGAVILDGGSLDLGASSDTIGSLTGPGTVTTTTGVLTVAGRLAGGLAVGNIGLAPQATFSPSVGLQAGGTSTVAGLTVAGTVDLGGSSLDLSITGRADVGQSVTLVDNDGSDPVIGGFAGLPGGTVFLAGNGQTFRIDYAGGDGNDIVLTRVLVGLTVTGIAVDSRPYDGGTIAPLNLGQVTLEGLVPGDPSTTLVTVGATGAYGDPNAGFNKPVTVTGLSLTGALADNYVLLTPDVTGTIAKAQTSIEGPASVVYSGDGQRGVVVGYGLHGEFLGTAFTSETVTDAGVYAVTWLFVSPDPNYDDASGDGTFTIEQADATVVVSPYVTTYDGQVHSAIGTVTGVKGEDLSSWLDLAVVTSHLDAGIYDDAWTFISPDPNYRSASGSITNTILKATATITVTPYTVIDDLLPHTAIGVATGVNGEDLSSGLLLEGTTHAEPGTYADQWSFISPNPNYEDFDPGVAIVNTILPRVYAAPIVALETDTGTDAADGITSQGALSVTGVEAGNGIEYSIDAGQSWSGAFTAAEGSNVVLVRQFDGRGGLSPEARIDFTLDTGRPVAPAARLAHDTGASPLDGVTNDATLSHDVTLATLFGTGVDASGHLAVNWATDLHYTLVSLPGGTDVVRVAAADNGYPIGPWVAATGASSWIGPASDDVLNGPSGWYVYRTTFDLTGIVPATVSIHGVWAADDVGVEILINGRSQGYATWNSPGYWSFETFAVTGGFVEGINTLDFVLFNGGGPTGLRVEMSGAGSTVEPGATIEYSTDDGSTWSPQWTPVEGLNHVRLRQIDSAGNVSDPTTVDFTLDTQVPVAPTVSLTNDTGVSRTDLITSVADLTIGKIESGATVEYSVDGGSSWTASFSAVEGANVLEVRQVDAAGNTSPTTRFAFTLDTSVLPVVAFRDGFGTLLPDGIDATTTLDFSACTVPLTFTVRPDGSLTVEDTNDPSANGLTFEKFGDVVGGQTANRFVFVGSAAMAGRVLGNATAINTLDYSASSRAVNVDLGIGLATGTGGIERMKAVIGSTVNGSAGGNTLVGPGGGQVWTISSGGSGVVGGVSFSGCDDLVAVSAGDTLDYSAFSKGVSVDLSLGLATGFRRIAGFRNVTGSAFDDILVGDANNNTLSGLAGDDTVTGLAGNDTLSGGAGTDTVIESANVDFTLAATKSAGSDGFVGNTKGGQSTGFTGNGTFTGGAGGGTAGLSGDVNVTLAATTLTGVGTDSLAGIETVNLSGGASANTFTVNNWTGRASLAGGSGNDTYVLSGTLAASVTIVEGTNSDTDTLDFSGLLNGGVNLDLGSTSSQSIATGVALTLSSDTGIENVVGTALADTLVGNARDNLLSGLAGDDTLTGLAGNDTFSGGAGVDTVIESADVDFTLAATTLAGTGTDSLAGIETVNLSGGASANTFTVNNWTGSASLAGGTGNDTYVFFGTLAASVTIVEGTNSDTDTLDFSGLLNGGVNLDLGSTASQSIATGVALTLSSDTGIENVVGTALADTLVGNTRDNLLSGLAGDDTLTGLAGNDAFSGGAGADTVIESADVDFTLAATTLAGTGSDSLAGIETVNLSAGASANTFTVNNWTGNASLAGGAGSDAYVFSGTTAASVAIVEGATSDADTLDFSGLLNGGVNVDLAVATVQTLVSGLTLKLSSVSAIENVIGTAFADTVRGNNRDNVLSGLAGADTLVGRAGDDTFIGSVGNDSFDGGIGTDALVESADIDFTLTAASLTGLGSDVLASIERVDLTAGSSANTFTVQGWKGSATLTGGGGNDRYVFTGTEAASVRIVEGVNADTDTLDFSGLLNGGVSLDLGSTASQSLVAGLTLTLSSGTGIENVIGTALADVLVGNTRDNLLSGLAGDDTLTGLAGNDTFSGGAGTDTVIESADVDFTLATTTLAGTGSDTLDGIETVNLTAGGSANTFTVQGWTGNAVLTGAAGNDSYVFVGMESARVTLVEVADADTDTLDFSALANGAVSVDLAVTAPQTVAAGLTLTLSSETGLETVIGTTLADLLVGNTRDNVLSGLAGDDTLMGRAGSDSIDGGADADSVAESANVDFALTAVGLTGLGTDTFTGIEGVNLTGGDGANSFTVSSWTGSASLAGGAGNDRYVFVGTESAGVSIVEAANTDSDTLDFSELLNGGVNLDLAVETAQTVVAGLTLTLSSSTGIENVIGTALADTLAGNGRDNRLSGLAGDDTLSGRTGNDILDGGTGGDAVVESGNIDFTLAAALLTGLGTETLVGIESIRLTGGEGANTFTLAGWTGAAVLVGGAGSDRYGFTGAAAANVTIVEGAGTDSDTLDFGSLTSGAVSIDLSSTGAQTVAVGLTLTLSSDTGIENVIGTALADVLVGNTRDNSLQGRAGDDRLTGLAGDDSLDGGDDADTVAESADVDFTLTSTKLTGMGTDALAGIETASLMGGVGANTFTMNAWTGSALLSGGIGDDVYAFSGTLSASVTIVEEAGADSDTLDFTSLANGGVNVDLAVTAVQTVVTGLTVTLSDDTGIENVIGSAFADSFLGNSRVNTLTGLGGDDTLTGRAGNDAFIGGDGTDTVAESADVDFTLTAASLVGLGTDSLAGIETVSLSAGAGANTLAVAGWTGDAILAGGRGDDSYAFSGTLSARVTIVEVADTDTDSLDFSGLADAGVSLDLAVTTAQTIVPGLTVTLSSGTGIENVIGTALADTIFGNARDNRLAGLTGANTLTGRDGDDTFTGGTGNDTFVGGAGTDTVVASGDVDLTLTPTMLTGLGSDALAGIEGVNLTAGSGANRFTLNGWSGSAILIGGAGDDRYVFSGVLSSSVTIIEAGNVETDTLDFSGLLNGGVTLDLAVTTPQSPVAGLTVTLSSATGIENLIGTAFADTVLGNARDNTLVGLAGDDALSGRSGDDTFTGGAGNDSIDGGSGSDMVTESGDVDFTLSATALVGVGSDGLAAVEAAVLTGGSGANTFTVQGWTGSAILTGGAGNDTYGFAGTVSAGVTIVEADDADTDALDFSNLANGGVTLDLAVMTPQSLVAGLTLTLSTATGIENVVGTAVADTLFGNTRDNQLSGLAGDDTFTGGTGNDTFVGGAGTDTVVASGDVDFTLTPTMLTGLGSDTLAGIEGVNLTAGSGANRFTLNGWSGSAILLGGAGDDRYVFSGALSSSVTIIEAGNVETDTLDVSGLLNGGVTLDLAVTAPQSLVAGLTVTLSSATGIENVIGTAYADTILGNARDNTLVGLAGDDALSGRAGDDTFTGGAGNDSIDGGSGSDTVTESGDVDFTLSATALVGVGSDGLAAVEAAVLTGGSGANTFTVQGWTGSAILTGGAGNDTYGFAGTVSAGVTIVEADDADTDALDFSNLANGGLTLDLAVTTPQSLVAGLTLTLSTATGIENVVGTAVADTLFGNTRDNQLSGLAGDDTLSGRAGNDRYLFTGTLSASVTIDEVADADADTLDFSGLSNSGLALDLGSTTPQTVVSGLTLTLTSATGLENAIGTAFADTLTGNSRDNRLSGLAGDDRLSGGAGIDTVVESADVDFTLTPFSLTGLGSDTLAGIEAAILTAGAGANTFTVNTWSGSATLAGGAGDDRYVFVGAVSASIAIVEDAATGTDALDFSSLSLSGDTGVSIDLALTTPQAVTATLSIALSDGAGIEDVTGTANADVMLGNARDNSIIALGGNDTLAGRAGSNTLDGGAGTDTVIETGNVDATVTATTIAGVGSDVLLGIEVVELVGGSGANTFTVNGWSGSLILEGGLGNDSYVFVGGTSTHVRVVEVANADADTLDFSAVTLSGGIGLTIDLASTTEQEVIGGLFVTLSDGEGIENVVGTAAADTMSGNSRDNTFRGLGGQDTIDGRGGTDTFVKTFGLVNVIVTDSSLTGCGTDSFHNIEVINVSLGSDPSECSAVGVEGHVLDASTFNGTLIADFGTDSLEITRSSAPSGVATNTLIIPALLDNLSVASGTIYLESEIVTGPGGSVTLDSSGAIIDDNDPAAEGVEPVNNIVASTLVLRAVGGIGSDNVLDTQVSVLSATNSGSGDISILNQKVVHGAVDVIAAVNAGGGVAVENYGDETHGITVSGTVRAKGLVSLISHSPLTIDGSIQSTSDSEITLEADTLSMTKTSKIVTTGDVAMNSRIVKLTDADMADAKIKNSRSDAQIDVSGGSFNTITSTGKGTQIDVRGGAFKVLTATNASSIDLAGGKFEVLTTSNVGKIDVSGGSFKTLNASGVGKIDVAGGSFEELTTSGSGAIGISDGSFKTVTVNGTSGIDVRGGKFGVLTTSSSGSIDVRGGSFTVMKTSGSGNIDVRGGSFTVLNTSGPGKIDVAGGDFGELIATGTGALGISDGSFKTVTVTGTGGIDVRGGKFSIGLGSSGSGKIDVSGGDFDQLVASGSGALGISDGSFKTVTVTGTGGIDVRGGKFSIGLGASGSGKIDVSGGDFDLLVASGSGALGISDGSFKTVTVTGTGGIDVRGGKFSVGLGVSGSGKIDVSGGDFDQLFASGSGALGISDGSFKTVTVTGTGGIDVRGGKFSVGLGVSGSGKIDVSGGDFDQLVASGSGALGISDGSFKTVTVTGTGGIDVRGGKFSVVTSSGSGKIDIAGGSFNIVNSSGGGKIDVAGGSFNTLNVSGSGGIDIRGGSFKVGVNSTGSGNQIDVTGATLASLCNTGSAAIINVSGASFDSITNSADNVTITVIGDAGNNALINSGNDVTISFLSGAGEDVFVNDGRGDGNHGNRVALTIDLGAGRDRAVLGGAALTGSVVGGDGDDTVLFVGGVTGSLALGEAADLDTDTLDFSSLTVVGGVGVSVDLAMTTTQVVKSGLSLTLSSGSGFENAVGSSGADTLRGNARDNALYGSDLPDDRLGVAGTSNGRVQVAYLDFDSETDPSVGDHVYTTAERAAIANRLAGIYSAFQVRFVLDVPVSGEYATIKFNKPRPNSEDSGGWASQVDFGNRRYDGIATVDVNGLLGVPGGPVATSTNFVASSAWLAAHELAHLMGMRHADSFGPPGFGIEAPPGRDGYLIDPAYVGPAAAWETDRHIIETPALTGFTLWDLVAVQFFGEREAIKLVYNEMAPMTPDGKLLVEERGSSHGSPTLSGAQELVPQPLSIPNTLNHGLNAGKDLMAGAVDVLGELTAAGELDLYRIAGRRGDLLNIQVMSAALDRYKHSSSSLDLDAVLTVYDASGNVVASSDDEFETHDPSIIDLVLPADGTYYIEVKGFHHEDGSAADTGSYELFLSRFDAASRDDGGDVLEGRDGNDTLSGGRGDDTYVFQGTVLGTDTILEDLRLEKSGIGVTGSPDGRDSGDTLDFTNFGTAVSIDLKSTAVQVVAVGDLSLRLSSAVDAADEPSAARGIERVLGGAQGNTLAGNARANTLVGGGTVNAFLGSAADDTFQLGAGSNAVDGGAGIDTVTLPGSAADYAITIGGSTATIASRTGAVPVSSSILTGVEVVRFTTGATATLLVGVGEGFASVQAAVDAASAGDTILVAAGTYSGAIDLDKDDLTLVSAAGSEATILLGAGASATVTVSATGVTVRGFGIDNAGVAGGSAILLRSSATATIDGNVIQSAESGVSHVDDGGTAGASITGNTFAGTVQSGVAGTIKLAFSALAGNTFRTSVEAIRLQSGVSLAGNALGRAGIFSLLDSQTIDLSGGAAVVDDRTNTIYAVAAPSVAEHLPTVATVPSTGLSGAATFTVIAGVDAGLFQIGGSTGVLGFVNLPRFTAPADLNADNVAEVIVQATDGTRNVVTRYMVSVINVNVAPEFAAATRIVNQAENLVAAGVGAASDWDLDTLGYSIAPDPTDNADGALFTIDPVTGTLAFKVAPDFENPTDADRDGIYQVRVAATDPGGLVTYQIVTVVVSDTNDNAPVFTSAATATVVENTAVSAVVYTATRTDADATAAFRNVSYSIKAGVGDGARMSIGAATGAVTLLAPADYETKTSYLFVVVADDGVNRAERIVTLNVIDTNDNAPVITSVATGSVTENAATTTAIYVATRTDADVTAAYRQVTYSVKPGVGDAALVAIAPATGVVTLLAPADYETKTSYLFTIVASDGLNVAEKSATVNVVDVNDNAPVITSGATGSVIENAVTTTVIYTATRTDADVTAAFRQVTYSIKAAVGDAAKVVINATTGSVTLVAPADYETKTSYLFTVIADDGVFKTEQPVTVNVIDVNDNAPVITSGTTGTVVENAATSTVIYTATRTDADVTAAFRQVTYSVKPAVGDAAKVTINAATGAVTLLAPADYETKTSYLFTVVADDGVYRAEKAVTVAVTDLNDNAPVFTSAATGSVTENAPTTTVIYTATRTDADVTAAFRAVTYSIKPAVGDATKVAIQPTTGAVTLLASADYETKTSYVFTVIADDGVNKTEQAVTVAVINIDDTAAIFTSARTASVVASATLNPAVYTATVNDSADVSQGVAFSLATADATLFAIDATTGVVTVKGSTLAMKGKSYTFTVTATDKGGAKKSVSQVITLTVT